MTAYSTKNILMVMPDKIEGDTERQQLLSHQGFGMRMLTPTLLSAFTAIAIASECDKQNITLVHTFRPADAMAAISARRISKKSDFKIVLEFPANSNRPRSIRNDIINGIDAWVFQTPLLADLASASTSPKLIMTASHAPSGCSAHDNATSASGQLPADKSQHLLWIGPLDKNIDTLKQTIRLVGRASGNLHLTVAGTGPARYAMQAVRLSRTLPEPALVTWLGDNYSLNDLLPSVTGIVQSMPEPSPVELDLACNLCLCQPGPEGLSYSSAKPLSARQRADRLANFYLRI